MKNLSKEINNSIFHNLYLLHGPEKYLRSQFTDRLKKAIIGTDTMNINVFRDPAPDVGRIMDLADTVPFFAEKRLIIVVDSGYFAPTRSGEASSNLAAYLPSLPDSTIIIFSEKDVDKRSKLYKYAAKNGSVTDFPEQKPEVLVKWILSLAGDGGLSISKDTAAYFVERTGSDMTLLFSEWTKLCSYVEGESLIKPAHIDAICSPAVEERVFEMIDDMSEGRGQGAFHKYKDLLTLNTPSMRILYLLVRHFRILYDVETYRIQNTPRDTIASNLGIRPYFMSKYLKQAEHYGIKRLRSALESCAVTETNIKTGLIKDSTGVETLIFQYSN